MLMHDIGRVKDLMYDTGMTRLEAEAYAECVEGGTAMTDYAMIAGCSRTLVNRRVLNARRKILEAEHDR